MDQKHFKKQDTFKDQVYFKTNTPDRVEQNMIGKQPHNLIGALLMEKGQKQNTILGLGTAFLISPDVILTSAHNVISSDTLTPFKSFRFYLGQHGPLKNDFYKCRLLYYPKQFLEKNNSTTDYALLQLQRPTQIQIFMDMEVVWSVNEGEKIALYGYESHGQEIKYDMELYQSGVCEPSYRLLQFRQDKHDLIHTLSTSSGHSGSPILLLKKNSPPTIFGIHKGGITIAGESQQKNCGRHIDNKLKDELRKEIVKSKNIFEDTNNTKIIVQFEEGENFMALKKWSQAENRFNMVLKYDQNHMPALCNKARGLLKQKKFKEALQISQKALNINERSAFALCNCGWALWGLKKFQQSLKHLKQAIRINPDLKEAHLYMGNSLDDLGKSWEAIEYFDNALKIDPNYIEAFNNKGLSLYSLRKINDALKQFQKALKIDPQNNSVHSNMGLSFYALRDFKKAIKSYQIALSIGPHSKEVHYNMGLSLFELKEYEQSIKHYQKALQYDSTFEKAYYDMGHSFKALKNYQKSIQCYKKALDIDPMISKIHHNIGLSLFFLKLYQDSIKQYEKAAYDYSVNFKQLYHDIGNSFKDWGKKDDAVQYYIKAIKIDPFSKDYYKDLIQVLTQNTKRQRAILLLKEISNMQPSCYEIYQAIQLLSKEIQKNPKKTMN